MNGSLSLRARLYPFFTTVNVAVICPIVVKPSPLKKSVICKVKASGSEWYQARAVPLKHFRRSFPTRFHSTVTGQELALQYHFLALVTELLPVTWGIYQEVSYRIFGFIVCRGISIFHDLYWKQPFMRIGKSLVVVGFHFYSRVNRISSTNQDDYKSLPCMLFSSARTIRSW